MRYATDMASDGTIHVPSFMKIGSDIQAMLPGQFERS
jgi:hypothetical protein